MKEIQLSKTGKKRRKYVALVDDEDYDYLNQWNWSYSKGYACRSIVLKKKREIVRMHRLIMKAPDNLEIDHIDHNGLNNQKLNLRIVTRKENANNSKNKLIGDGIYLKSIRYHGWIIYYIKDDKTMILDHFDTQEEALFNIKKSWKCYLESI